MSKFSVKLKCLFWFDSKHFHEKNLNLKFFSFFCQNEVFVYANVSCGKKTGKPCPSAWLLLSSARSSISTIEFKTTYSCNFSKKMWNVIFDVWTTGIDFDLPGNGGPACAKYLSPQRRILEFLLGTTLALMALFVGWRLHSKPSTLKMMPLRQSRRVLLVTKFLLISMILTYLVEIGYKFYTNQAVFIFNPCHCLCVVQIVILYSLISAIKRDQEPSNSIVYLFRIHLYLLHGPL